MTTPTWDFSTETLAALQRLFEDEGLTSGPLTTRAIGDGHSNLTFLVSDSTSSVVLRRPPPPPTPPGAHDMLREARILDALRGGPVPVPTVLATSRAGEVLDVDFYVMSRVEGPVVTTSSPAGWNGPEVRRLAGHALVDTLAALHAVDHTAVGLQDLGRPEGFNRRHLARMARLIADEQGEPPAHFATLTSWLQAHVPDESGAVIVHNDFRLGNVVLDPSPGGGVAAVLDWELATLGDPLFDVGYFLMSVPDPAGPSTPTAELGAAMLEDGWPSRAELAARYAEQTGRDLTGLEWYCALALWKLAVLYEYGRRRAVRGVGDPYYADPALVQAFLVAAHAVAGLPGDDAAALLASQEPA